MQALNLENYLYLAVASVGLVTVVQASGAALVMIGIALVAIGYMLNMIRQTAAQSGKNHALNPEGRPNRPFFSGALSMIFPLGTSGSADRWDSGWARRIILIVRETLGPRIRSIGPH
jgi:uncharacterized membrane protein